MKIFGYIPVHYGAEYLRQCAEALAPHVDKLLVLYTPQPSFGQRGDRGEQNPDTEEQLRACCDRIGPHKLVWARGDHFANEGQHRGTAEGIAINAGADLIVTADTDEIWDEVSLASCIRNAFDRPAGRFLIAGFVHFWRSFDRCCRDVWAPVRLKCPGMPGERTIEGTIYHFGYAQAEKTVAYKIACHGHKAEWRPEWWEKIFLDPARTQDLHPVVRDWWNAEPFDKSTLPVPLKAHPNFHKELIR